MRAVWFSWPLQRILYLFLAVAFLAVFVQVTLFHMRQNFYHPSQWLPVVVTPVLGILALVVVWWPASVLVGAFTVFSIFGVAIGLVGTYYHVAGTGQRVGGYSVNNFMVGPPPMLPMMVVVLSALGLVVMHGV
jgi:hypothetical protein